MFRLGVNENGHSLDPNGANPQPVSTKNEFPSFIQQTTNFVKSVVKHIGDGMKQVTDEEQLKRLEMCRGCEHYADNGGNARCTQCGCFLSVKTSWASEKCPIGKWLPILKNDSGCPCNDPK